MITPEILIAIYPATPQTRINAVVEPLNRCLTHYDIMTPPRASAFIAQVGHESGGFVAMVENLNYSAKGLRSVFGKYFSSLAVANQYARQPRKIANRVYANRMGNGSEASGDGYAYRGRGFIQLTGKETYLAFAKSMGMTLPAAIAYLETIEGAMMSAGWFWDKRKINQYADRGRDGFDKVTQLINGGQNGAADRLAHYDLARLLIR